jgi:hypothetical protein
MGDATRHEQRIERQLVKASKWRYRPTPAGGDFLVDGLVYCVSGRSLNSSRKTEFGASGHCRISTSDVGKLQPSGRSPKRRPCAIDPLQPVVRRRSGH